MNTQVNSDSKIEIKIGCADYLLKEVESLRAEKRIADAQLSVMNNFFELVGRIGDKPRVGYGEDDLYRAKREISDAKEKLIQSLDSK